VNHGAGPAPLPSPPLLTLSTVIGPPWYGGSLEAPDGRVRLDFPGNWVSQATRVAYTDTGPQGPLGNLQGVRFFELSAVVEGTTTPVTTFNSAFMLTARYGGTEIAGGVEESLALYRWNGEGWIREPTSRLDAGNDRLTATLDRMGLYAVLGETCRLYLPSVGRN
jgi:hypothetical protein